MSLSKATTEGPDSQSRITLLASPALVVELDGGVSGIIRLLCVNIKRLFLRICVNDFGRLAVEFRLNALR